LVGVVVVRQIRLVVGKGVNWMWRVVWGVRGRGWAMEMGVWGGGALLLAWIWGMVVVGGRSGLEIKMLVGPYNRLVRERRFSLVLEILLRKSL